MGVRSSRRWQKPATFAQVIGAGEGNRTLDIQLGKLSAPVEFSIVFGLMLQPCRKTTIELMISE
jgi:hypothetical protein